MAHSSRNGPTPSFNQPYNRNTSDHVTPDTNLENQGRFSPSHGQGDSAVHTSKFSTGVQRRDDPLRAAAGVTDSGPNWPSRLESKPDGALAHNTEGHDRKPTAYSSAPIYNPLTHQPIEERPSAGKSSVPRKQVGSSPTGQFSDAQSIPSIGETRSTTNSPPLYMPSGRHDGDHGIKGKERKSHASDIPDRLNPNSRNLYGDVTGDNIVDKAKSNTIDTEVVEAWAPGSLSHPQ